jgi:hypothetical protein
MSYYKEMFRLWEWQWPPQSGIQGPRYAGKLTKKLIYEQLPPGVLDEIERLNPPDENWQRKNKNSQFLTDDIGQPHLEKQIAIVTSLMTISDDREQFKRNVEKLYKGTFPDSRQGSLLDILDALNKSA